MAILTIIGEERDAFSCRSTTWKSYSTSFVSKHALSLIILLQVKIYSSLIVLVIFWMPGLICLCQGGRKQTKLHVILHNLRNTRELILFKLLRVTGVVLGQKEQQMSNIWVAYRGWFSNVRCALGRGNSWPNLTWREKHLYTWH